MKKKNTRITGSEREVLELLWEENQPLTSAEIVKISEHKTWKPSYIHLMINSLLKKNVIQVAGFKQTTKNYARTFTPTMTREEFSIRMLREENQLNASSLSLLFGALLEEDVDMGVIDELSDMLQKKKEELEAADSGISQDS